MPPQHIKELCSYFANEMVTDINVVQKTHIRRSVRYRNLFFIIKFLVFLNKYDVFNITLIKKELKLCDV